jgi:hypothetical protein
MNQQPSQSAAKVDLRQHMPETARWVAEKRVAFGKDFVNDCIRRSLQGEEGLFYAIERGHVLGTPFPATHIIAHDQQFALMTGCSFAAFMVEPPKSQGAVDGAN